MNIRIKSVADVTSYPYVEGFPVKPVNVGLEITYGSSHFNWSLYDVKAPNITLNL